MQFQTQFFRYVTTSAGNAVIALGADTDPRTAYGTPGAPPLQAPPKQGVVTTANQDNILSCRVNGVSAPVAVARIAVAMCGPTGAANQNANLYVWDQLSNHWYLMNASPIVLVQNQVLFFDALSLCEAPVRQGAQLTSQGGADYMLVVAAATPTAGQYSFVMSAMLNVP